MGRKRAIRKGRKKAKKKTINVGQIVKEMLSSKIPNERAASSLVNGTCCKARCNAPYVCVYMGFPLCERHMNTVDRVLDRMIDDA